MSLHPTFTALLSAHGWTEEEPQPEERYQLRGWAGGYRIYDHGELICTFHGPQFDLAAKTLRRLKDEAESAPSAPTAA
jgi:hypothetical protein